MAEPVSGREMPKAQLIADEDVETAEGSSEIRSLTSETPKSRSPSSPKYPRILTLKGLGFRVQAPMQKRSMAPLPGERDHRCTDPVWILVLLAALGVLYVPFTKAGIGRRDPSFQELQFRLRHSIGYVYTYMHTAYVRMYIQQREFLVTVA